MMHKHTDTNDTSLMEIMKSIKDAQTQGSLSNNGIIFHLLDVICNGKYNISQRDPEMIKKALNILSRQGTSRSKNPGKEDGEEEEGEGWEEEEKEKDSKQSSMSPSESEILLKKRSRMSLVPPALLEFETNKFVKLEDSQIKTKNPQKSVEISNQDQQTLSMQLLKLAAQMKNLKREQEEIKLNVNFGQEKVVKVEEGQEQEIKQEQYQNINLGIQERHFKREDCKQENLDYSDQFKKVDFKENKNNQIQQSIELLRQNCLEQSQPAGKQITNIIIQQSNNNLEDCSKIKIEEPSESNPVQIQESQQIIDSQLPKGPSSSNSNSYLKLINENKDLLVSLDSSTFQGQQEEKMREYKELEDKRQMFPNDKKGLQKERQHWQQVLHWYKISLESIEEILQILGKQFPNQIGFEQVNFQAQEQQQNPVEMNKICDNVKIEQDCIEKQQQQENSSQLGNLPSNQLNNMQICAPQRVLIDSRFWRQTEIHQEQSNQKSISINNPKLTLPTMQMTSKSIYNFMIKIIDDTIVKWRNKLKQFIETEHFQWNGIDLMQIIQQGIINSRIDQESTDILTSQQHDHISKELNYSIQRELIFSRAYILTEQQSADNHLQELIRVNFWPKKYKYTREKGPKHKQQEIEEEIVQNKLLQHHNKQLLMQITTKKFQTLKSDHQSKREYIKLENYLIKRHQDERKLSKKLQLHNQMKNFIMYAIRYIAEKVQYPDPHEIQSHRAILKSFHLSYNKSDLQALTTPYEPYTLEHIQKVLALASVPKEQFKHNKHFLFQKEMIMKYNPELFQNSISNIKIEAEIREDGNTPVACSNNDHEDATNNVAKTVNILNNGNIEKVFDLETLSWEDLYNNPQVLEIFNKEILRIKKFNEQNRILMQAFCLFEYTKIILAGKGNKIDHLYGNQFILSALRFPEIIQL